MKTIINGIFTYIPTKEKEVTTNKRVYELYNEENIFSGYRVKVNNIVLRNGKEVKRGLKWEKCQKGYIDQNNKNRFIIC